METDSSKIDFHTFVDNRLAASGFRIRLVTKEIMDKRLDDFMAFLNGIRSEYSRQYEWKTESREYFLNGLVDKWKYSFAIINQRDEICFVNFSSVYGDVIHYHFAYARRDVRSLNLSKLHMVKLCQVCIQNGFSKFEAYWPKNNTRSIILYLKMGWEIEGMRNNREVFMTGDIAGVRDRTYHLLVS